MQPEARDEEVARAFEAWRGEVIAEDEARHAQTSGSGDEARTSDATPVAAPAAGDATTSSGAGEASRSSSAGGAEAQRARGPVMPEPLVSKSSLVVADDEGEEASSAAKVAGAVGATRRRAASVVKESIAPRVERVRDRSIGMLEEAPDDSGLRFVLLAAVMFALFILLLVLSTVIK